MNTHKIAVIAGDGIGPEVIAEGVKVLDAAARRNGFFRFEFTHFPWGCEYYLREGRMMPEDALETLKGFDAFFSGHHHAYWRFNPNSKEARIIPSAAQLANKKWKYPAPYLSRRPMPDRFPFADCFLDKSDVVTCEVSPEKLLVKAHNYNKKDGSLHDAFEIYPDGMVKDAAEGVRAYPIPEYKPKKGK